MEGWSWTRGLGQSVSGREGGAAACVRTKSGNEYQAPWYLKLEECPEKHVAVTGPPIISDSRARARVRR